jgi:hypothetical protein
MYNEAISTSRDPHVMKSSLEGADLGLGQLSQGQFAIIRSFSLKCSQNIVGLSLTGASDSLYESDSQSFQGIYLEEHAPLNSSARPDEQLPVPAAQVNQVKDKVKCTRYGCLALVNKDNLNRHVKEVHEGKIKVVCAGCGREFKRSYQMNEHILRSGCGRS